MDDEINGNSLVYNHYLELSKPTKADFERVFTEDELKKLCLKHKCRVNMWRWNVVNDYRILFTESGRYQRWPEDVRLGMLAKAVNKMKHSVLYDEQEIIKTRKEEWDFQLKENILSLNFWQRKRLHSTEPHNSPRLVVTDSEDMDEGVEYAVNTETMNEEEFLTQTQSQQTPTEEVHFNRELQLQIEVNTESLNASELLSQQQQQQPIENITTNATTRHSQTQGQQVPSKNLPLYIEFDQEVQSEIEVNTESMLNKELPLENIPTNIVLTQAPSAQSDNAENLLCQIEEEEFLIDDDSESELNEEPPLENIPTNRVLTQAPSTQSDRAENLLCQIEEGEFLIDDESGDSVKTVLYNEPQLQSEEVIPEIDNIYGVNTMSMTIDSQMNTQSQDLPLLQSQDVIPASYDNFKNIIPLTSTQSQSQASEEIIVS